MGISVKRALEGKVGKQMIEYCWVVEEVGKEQRPLGVLVVERWAGQGKGMRK